MSTKRYKVAHNPELSGASLEPSDSSSSLIPQEGVAELRTHIQDLDEELRQLQDAFVNNDLDVADTLEKMRRLVMELELARQCLRYLEEGGGCTPWTSKKVNRLYSAPH
jgi:DNA-binding transcriptional MerR regulator